MGVLPIIMLDQIRNIVERNAQQSIIQNKAVPDQFNQAVIRDVSNQILGSLKGQVEQGNLQQLVSLFQGGTGRTFSNHPVIGNIISSVATSLSSRFNIPAQDAKSVATSLVPTVMSEVVKKTNDPRDIDFDLQQMVRGLTGDQSLDISSMLNQMPKGKLGNVGNIIGKLFGGKG